MGKLYIVATPIGNLQDLTFRALDILKKVDLIICEDTRRTLKLLNHFLPSETVHQKTLVTLNDFNERQKSESLLQRIVQYQDAVLISDAGTPLLSDPGFHLVRLAIENNVPLEIIPGPSAAVSSALISGLPTDRILFWGFLPKKNNDKKKIFEQFNLISNISPTTFILFESPFRVKDTLSLLQSLYQRCSVVLVRELTKIHQEIVRGTPAEVLAKVSNQPKGEITLVLRLNIDPKGH